MNSKLKILLVLAALAMQKPGWGQNFLGYSKEYVKEAVDDQFRKLSGPAEMNDGKDNYLLYVSEDGKRVVIYYFDLMPVTLTNGNQVQAEICVKYFSKTKCDYQQCPQMDKVIKSLDSHFDRGADMQWIDHSKKIPQEWVIVRDEDYFELHVLELKEK